MNRTSIADALDALILDYPRVKILRAAFDEDANAKESFIKLIHMKAARRALDSAIGYSDKDEDVIAQACDALDDGMLELSGYVSDAVYNLYGVHCMFILDTAAKISQMIG